MGDSLKRSMVKTLKSIGAVKRREGRHEVWQLPSGATFTMSRSPSDGRAYKNMRATLRRLMRKSK